MGRAQVVQAEAAGVKPSVLMNPILLKPTNDKGSQIIVNGEVQGDMNAVDYFKYKKKLVPDIIKAYNKLSEMYDIIVIEGAGSPAEINLKQDDIVNMGMAKLVDAPVILVADIDKGGVFASIYGKWLTHLFCLSVTLTGAVFLHSFTELLCCLMMRKSRELRGQL